MESFSYSEDYFEVFELDEVMYGGDQLEGSSGETVGVGNPVQEGDLLDRAGGADPEQFRDGGMAPEIIIVDDDSEPGPRECDTVVELVEEEEEGGGSDIDDSGSDNVHSGVETVDSDDDDNNVSLGDGDQAWVDVSTGAGSNLFKIDFLPGDSIPRPKHTLGPAARALDYFIQPSQEHYSNRISIAIVTRHKQACGLITDSLPVQLVSL